MSGKYEVPGAWYTEPLPGSKIADCYEDTGDIANSHTAAGSWPHSHLSDAPQILVSEAYDANARDTLVVENVPTSQKGRQLAPSMARGFLEWIRVFPSQPSAGTESEQRTDLFQNELDSNQPAVGTEINQRPRHTRFYQKELDSKRQTALSLGGLEGKRCTSPSQHELESNQPPGHPSYEPEGKLPIVIAVFGKTGTGKTSFINAVTEEGLVVGHNLESCKYYLPQQPSSC